MADVRFSLFAALATALVAGASAANATWPVAIVFGLLAVGFLLRAAQGYRRR
jgi:hypothetical protein